MPINNARMAITTRSSIRVNPLRAFMTTLRNRISRNPTLRNEYTLSIAGNQAKGPLSRIRAQACLFASGSLGGNDSGVP
jgi:hypothetical protein